MKLVNHFKARGKVEISQGLERDLLSEIGMGENSKSLRSWEEALQWKDADICMKDRTSEIQLDIKKCCSTSGRGIYVGT